MLSPATLSGFSNELLQIKLAYKDQFIRRQIASHAKRVGQTAKKTSPPPIPGGAVGKAQSRNLLQRELPQ